MFIELVNVSVEDKGKYKMMKTAYRNNGKLAEKTLMSFGASADVFDVLSKAKAGDTFEVTSVKNDKGFWDWTTISSGEAPAAAKAEGNKAPGRTSFETPEERAARQVLIVRQSSLSSAIEYFKTDPKNKPTVEQVIEVADKFVDFVFQKKDTNPVMELENDFPF